MLKAVLEHIEKVKLSVRENPQMSTDHQRCTSCDEVSPEF